MNDELLITLDGVLCLTDIGELLIKSSEVTNRPGPRGAYVSFIKETVRADVILKNNTIISTEIKFAQKHWRHSKV